MDDVRVWSKEMRCHLVFSLRDGAQQRLSRERFRGRDLRRAGNFCRFETLNDLFQDEEFIDKLAFECMGVLQGVDLKKSTSAFYIEVEYSGFVGWSCTDDLANYQHRFDTLEPYQVNFTCHGLRVRPECTHVLAPKTKIITVACQFQKWPNGIGAIVRTLYPGPSIGPLRPDSKDLWSCNNLVDLSKREQIVFFDPQHPGERLAS